MGEDLQFVAAVEGDQVAGAPISGEKFAEAGLGVEALDEVFAEFGVVEAGCGQVREGSGCLGV